jgi:hypothetical protein
LTTGDVKVKGNRLSAGVTGVRRAMLAVKAKWAHPLCRAQFVLTGADEPNA